MKVWTTVVALVAMLGIALAADAQGAGGKGRGKEGAGVHGKITAVDVSAKTITVTHHAKKGGNAGESEVIDVSGVAANEIKLDGQVVTLDQLAAAVGNGIGAHFPGATKDNLKATRVEAHTHGAVHGHGQGNGHGHGNGNNQAQPATPAK